MSKVGILVNNLDVMGGCEIVSLRLLKGFLTNGINTVLLSVHPSKNTNCISMNIIPSNKHGLSVQEVDKLVDSINSNEITTLIIQVDGMMSPVFTPEFINRVSKKMSVYPVIHNSPASFVTCYGLNGDFRPYSVLRSLKNRFYNNQFCRKRCISINNDGNIKFVTLTQRSRYELKEYCKKDSIVIPNIVPEINETGIQENKKNNVLFIGRIENYQKNIVRLIKAWKLAELKDWNLIVLGDGPDFNFIKKQADKLNNCEMLGRVDNNTVQEMLSLSKVLILTSNYEGFPTVFTEAMINKATIITTKFDGFPEEIMKHGDNCYVSNDDPESIANSLKSVCNDLGLLEKIALGGYRDVRLILDCDPIKLWINEAGLA